jgi:hypothetical protein
VAAIDGLGLEVLSDDDPGAAARAVRPTVLRLIRAVLAVE